MEVVFEAVVHCAVDVYGTSCDDAIHFYRLEEIACGLHCDTYIVIEGAGIENNSLSPIVIKLTAATSFLTLIVLVLAAVICVLYKRH